MFFQGCPGSDWTFPNIALQNSILQVFFLPSPSSHFFQLSAPSLRCEEKHPHSMTLSPPCFTVVKENKKSRAVSFQPQYVFCVFTAMRYSLQVFTATSIKVRFVECRACRCPAQWLSSLNYGPLKFLWSYKCSLCHLVNALSIDSSVWPLCCVRI